MTNATKTDQRLKPARRGLVLAGGGAKGAYAFGCLCAFEQAQIRFEAISGTSVGALNGALLASGKMKEGWAFWRELSFASVYPFSLIGIRRWSRLSKLIAHVFAIVFVAMHAFVYSVGAHPSPLKTTIRIAVYMAFLILAALIIWEFRPPWFVACLLVVNVIFIFALPISVALAPSSWGEKTSRITLLPVWIVSIALTGFISGMFGLDDTSFSGILVVPIAVAVMLALVSIASYLMRKFADLISRRSVFSSQPLDSAITKIFAESEFGVPTYACMAHQQWVYEPYDDWIPRDSGPQSLGSLVVPTSIGLKPDAIWSPTVCSKWVAEYVRVDAQSALDRRAALLASAALPFGIVPFVDIDGLARVDGGVVDNIPWYPLIEHDLDEIWVVALDRRLKMSKVERAEWERKTIEREIAGLLIPEPITTMQLRASGKKTCNELYPPPSVPPAPNFPELKVFLPKSDLGNLLTGTLQFSSEYARRTAQQGFDETRRRLEVELDVVVLPGSIDDLYADAAHSCDHNSAS